MEFLLFLLLIGGLFVCAIGYSHARLTLEDQIKFDTASPRWRGFVQFCKVVTILLHLALVGVLAWQCVGRSGSSDDDCDYTSRGRTC